MAFCGEEKNPLQKRGEVRSEDTHKKKTEQDHNIMNIMNSK